MYLNPYRKMDIFSRLYVRIKKFYRKKSKILEKGWETLLESQKMKKGNQEKAKKNQIENLMKSV